MIIVASKRTDAIDQYVGRPTPLGNPYAVSVYGHDVCIDMYREWFIAQLDSAADDSPFYKQLNYLAAVYKDKGTLTLLCWCAPKTCHADVIAEYLEANPPIN